MLFPFILKTAVKVIAVKAVAVKLLLYARDLRQGFFFYNDRFFRFFITEIDLITIAQIIEKELELIELIEITLIGSFIGIR